MGFTESYNVLSPASLVSWQASNKEGKPAGQDQASPQSIVSLDCKSWLLSGLRSLLRRDGSALASGSNSSGSGSYKRPSKWKRLFRRCRARTRKMQSSCYDSYCAEPKLHHYKTESYERNFDRGREYWHDLPFLDISPFCSPPSSSHPARPLSRSSPSFQQQQQQQQEFLWKRRNHFTAGQV